MTGPAALSLWTNKIRQVFRQRRCLRCNELLSLPSRVFATCAYDTWHTVPRTRPVFNPQGLGGGGKGGYFRYGGRRRRRAFNLRSQKASQLAVAWLRDTNPVRPLRYPQPAIFLVIYTSCTSFTHPVNDVYITASLLPSDLQTFD